MTRPLAVLRPEPGNAATAARVEAMGLRAIRLPLFTVCALAWTPPDPAGFDALILTSANAARHAGPEIARFADLPVYAVGLATADAAREAGLHVRLTGGADAATLLADARANGVRHALHLGGRETRIAPGPGVAASIAVYASDEVPAPDLRRLPGSVALIHSPRAGGRLAALVADRAAIRLAAVSRAAAEVAGGGWDRIAVSAAPADQALLAAARTLAD